MTARPEPEWSDGAFQGRSAGVFRTVCRAIWAVGLTGDQRDIELYAGNVTLALQGIVPDDWYES